jgi:hypothetical protein
MFVVKTVTFVVLALSMGSFVQEAFAEELVTINQKQQGLQENESPKKLRFIDENGDGLNDLIQDSDGDGIPDGRMCDGSGWRGFYRQGSGKMMMNGAENGGFGRGFGKGFRQGRGGR